MAELATTEQNQTQMDSSLVPSVQHRRKTRRSGRGRNKEDSQTPQPFYAGGYGHTRTGRNFVLDLGPASSGSASNLSSAQPSSRKHLAAAEVDAPQLSRPTRGWGGVKTGPSRPSGRAYGNGDDHNGDESAVMNRQNLVHHGGRQFGGRLTSQSHRELSIPMSTSVASVLKPDALEFRPGKSHTLQVSQNERFEPMPMDSKEPRHTVSRKRRDSSIKSTAPDIATRTHEDIINGIYECPICTSEVARNSQVWSCKTCWTVFHLSCIKKWSQNEGSTLARQRTEIGEIPPPRQWRCPGCNLPNETLPSTYSCWCEKETDPRPISGIPPHSCGQTCGKHRILPKKCPHPCELLCHAGPCFPCTHTGPLQSCFCGKKSTSRRCVDTNYDTGWSCGEVCGDIMPCGEHICQNRCHEGLCGACEVRVEGRCYCGKANKAIICCEREERKESNVALLNPDAGEAVESWTGIFDCGDVCERPFDCKKHICEKPCHPQQVEDPHCPRSPDAVAHCPCGKTLLVDIVGGTRQTCEDPIPNCQEKCSKALLCGHSCQQVCHAGPCRPCLRVFTIKCRCGRTSSQTLCHQGKEEPPQCRRVCKVALNCGRHECGERCCQGERKAAERQALRRKLRPLGTAPRAFDKGFEAEHICTRVCGRILKCGSHTCPELCHKGPCGSCREAMFEDISCRCGRTILQAPLPCGSKPPPCRFECDRSKRCGHPQTAHNCHGDQESCPKCPFLTEKPCMCGKKTLKNQPCWFVDVRCGEICLKKLKCGSHFCQKPCHRSGECEDYGRLCQQLCGKAKKICGHPCEELCHAPSSCRGDKPCQNKVLITCGCQHFKQEIKCNASKTSEGNGKRSLKCDDECARLERNRRLALALNIDPEAHKDDHIPYSTATIRMFQESIKWSQKQECEFRVFAADEREKRLRFKPMPPHQRAFIHSLSEDFGLDSESLDPEPYRHVFVFKTPRFATAPVKTISECIKIRNAVNEPAASTITAEAQWTPGNGEPFNGFLLCEPRFALTLEEVRSDLHPVLESIAELAFDISFLPSEEIVLKAQPLSTAGKPLAVSLEATLKALKSPLSSAINAKKLAGSFLLCTLDNSLNIIRKERESSEVSNGWSQVVAKGSASARSAPGQQGFGSKSSFTILASRLKDVKRKKEDQERMKHLQDEVANDWEEDSMKEEARETREGRIVVGEQGVVGQSLLNETYSDVHDGVIQTREADEPSLLTDAGPSELRLSEIKDSNIHKMAPKDLDFFTREPGIGRVADALEDITSTP